MMKKHKSQNIGHYMNTTENKQFPQRDPQPTVQKVDKETIVRTVEEVLSSLDSEASPPLRRMSPGKNITASANKNDSKKINWGKD
jgi:hypothetical protein